MIDSSEKKVIEKVNELADDLISIARELISIPTINPPGEHYRECADFLSKTFGNVGLDAETVEVPDDRLSELAPEGKGLPRPNVVAKLTGEKRDGSILHFNGHYDVVPAQTDLAFDLFRPIIKNGRIYGRGACDMKGAIAAMTIAAKAIVESDIRLKGSLVLSATPDEETDGLAGTAYIIKEGIAKADYCIVGEPSGSRNIWNAHKGTLWMEVTTLGKAAHGSSPWLGSNAFEEMAKFAHAIDLELKPKMAKKVSSHRTIPPDGQTGTITLGGIVKTGKAINIVPDRCLMTVDRRLIPEETLDEAKSEISNLLNRLQSQDREFRFETKIVSQFDACLTPSNSPIVTETVNAVRDVTRIDPTVTMCIAGLDMRHFVNAGIPTIAYGPGDLRVAHTADEYVSIDELVEASKVYALVAMRLLK